MFCCCGKDDVIGSKPRGTEPLRDPVRKNSETEDKVQQAAAQKRFQRPSQPMPRTPSSQLRAVTVTVGVSTTPEGSDVDSSLDGDSRVSSAASSAVNSATNSPAPKDKTGVVFQERLRRDGEL